MSTDPDLLKKFLSSGVTGEALFPLLSQLVFELGIPD
jgi:hypothetical protein